MLSPEALRKRLLATFREEADEHIQELEAELAIVDKDLSSPEASQSIGNLFRVMHTLKGASRSVKLGEMESLCQECETLLRGLSETGRPLTADGLAFLKISLAKLQDMAFASVEEDEPADAPPKHPPPVVEDTLPEEQQPSPSTGPREDKQEPVAEEPPDDTSTGSPDVQVAPETVSDTGRAAALGLRRSVSPSSETIRVNIGRLDSLLLVAEDLLLPSMVAHERTKEAKRLALELADLRSFVRSNAVFRTGGRQDAAATHTEFVDALKSLETRARHLAEGMSEDQKVLNASVNELFEETRQLRMLPVSNMFFGYPSMVRDICAEMHKKSEWRLEDGGMDLDRKVLEVVKDPVMHLVRNAIAHGIELPAERIAAGKSEQGVVSVSILPVDGRRVAIEISDDGCGMDADAIRDAAIRARVAPAEQIRALSDEDVYDLAFRSGVSTRSVVSSISGMGLGLSIVREQIDRIDGRVLVRSEKGKGTTIRLELPTTIASYRGLLVHAAGAKLFWPSESVSRVIGVKQAQAKDALETGRILTDGSAIPVVQLSSVLGIDPGDFEQTDYAMSSCVITTDGTRKAAFLVDEVVGETVVMVKNLPMPLRRVCHIASAGLLPTGEMALVLRPSDVISGIRASVRRSQPRGRKEVSRTRTILVVDDSMTTRTMERNLLESVGYSVEVAADGAEAWQILQSRKVDLVVSDVDMPRLNGFELTEKIRNSSDLAELPVVLVTALEDRTDRDKGIQVGANAYVLKSGFDQSKLHEIVGRLI